MTRPRISISIDLDNQWSYMKTHGDAGWDAFPSYLDRAAEIILERLDAHGLTVTCFVVGQDAAIETNHAALRAVAGAGHEIGNHSFHHEPWLHSYSYEQVRDEIRTAQLHIEKATGQRPRGFRGPGYSLSRDTLRVLAEEEFLYDASTLPTFIGPLARAYYFWKSRGLSPEEREQRKRLFGSLRDGLRSNRSYSWKLESGSLVEIPVTTMPIFRVPIHLSYLLYLSRFSRRLAVAYLKLAIGLCRATRTEPSFLLHPLDFLGGDAVDGLDFFPGMDLDTGSKLRFVDTVIDALKAHFEPVTLEEHARAVAAAGDLPLRSFDAALIR